MENTHLLGRGFCVVASSVYHSAASGLTSGFVKAKTWRTDRLDMGVPASRTEFLLFSFAVFACVMVLTPVIFRSPSGTPLILASGRPRLRYAGHPYGCYRVVNTGTSDSVHLWRNPLRIFFMPQYTATIGPWSVYRHVSSSRKLTAGRWTGLARMTRTQCKRQ